FELRSTTSRASRSVGSVELLEYDALSFHRFEGAKGQGFLWFAQRSRHQRNAAGRFANEIAKLPVAILVTLPLDAGVIDLQQVKDVQSFGDRFAIDYEIDRKL